MTTSRRDFLGLLAGGAGVARVWAQGDAPAIKNYRPGGASLLIEGQTLLVEYQFAAPIQNLAGRLPLPIEPESLGGQALEEKQELSFYPSPDKRIWRTFLTAPLDVAAGTYQVQLNATFVNGQRANWASPYLVRRGVYRNTNITVNESYTAPSPAIQQRTQQDFRDTIAALAPRDERQWSQPFMLPTNGGYRDNYGDKRTYNRTKHKRHAGIDMSAAIGAPIRAMNDAIVALSADQWAPGQTVILNHGGGVFTKYVHLSRRHVNAGDQVKRGDTIALSGNTGGQKPAPHLHLTVLVNGAEINPLQFMRVAQQLLDAEAGRLVKL
jgi:murein DD-endopeptidase MepM/ murein hydrolase activator NlpD